MKGRNIAFRDRYQIRLTCGCVIVANNSPLNERVKYGCTTGQNHGYSLLWVAATGPNGFTRHNQEVNSEHR